MTRLVEMASTLSTVTQSGGRAPIKSRFSPGTTPGVFLEHGTGKHYSMFSSPCPPGKFVGLVERIIVKLRFRSQSRSQVRSRSSPGQVKVQVKVQFRS